MNFDSSLNLACNSARMAEQISRTITEKNKFEIEHRKKLEAGVEASIQQNELLKQQVNLLIEQNGQLSDNYNKLKEMYGRQVQESEAAKEDLRKSKRFNSWMMVIAIISMLAAVAGPVISIWG